MKRSKLLLGTLALIITVASVLVVKANTNSPRAIDVYYDPPGATTCAILFTNHAKFANSGTFAATLKGDDNVTYDLYATSACSSLARAYFIP